MKKLNIAVVGGGNSGEYNISVQSAQRVADMLNPALYNVYPITIHGRDWHYMSPAGVKVPVSRDDFSLNTEGRQIIFDCVFNAIHGTPGEDGKLQGYFEMLGIPHTSSGSITSALTFNKAFCNGLVSSYGVKVSRAVHLTRQNNTNAAEILNRLSLPLFVKPNCGGSSVGMSKVNDPAELQDALALAFSHDTEVLVEEFVAGREITCGVYLHGGRAVALPLVEVVSKKAYFDYEAKYDETLADEILPAPISPALTRKCQDLSVLLFGRLNCRGVARFDYILTEDEFCFLEVNTIPGMTAASIVPKMAGAAGFSLRDFYSMLIEGAISDVQTTIGV